MYVERIEIPSFRVLRDVVLEFGGGYDPQVFPLGSENGGGKSTALQLLFVLLHCSSDPARFIYLKNLLASDSGAGGAEHKVIARLSIRFGEEIHTLEFVSLNNRFLVESLKDPPVSGFDAEATLESRRDLLADTKTQRNRITENMALLRGAPQLHPHVLREIALNAGLFGYQPRNSQALGERLEAESLRRREEIKTVEAEIESLRADMERTRSILIGRNYRYITTYRCSTSTGWETRAVACRVPGQSASRSEELLSAASSKVFLLGPSNQQYLFLPKDKRNALLRTRQRQGSLKNPSPPESAPKPRPQIEYLTSLDEAETAMDGFYAYDWLSVEPLVQLFLSARDEDFQHAVKNGRYGERYTTLLGEVNGLLFGKKVRPTVDDAGKVSGIEFILTDDSGTETPLSPEDLSQGELKRLMIYAWLRANSAIDALVLIDEIEASFHPDWQVGIVRDLQEWGPKNQYLLATHSYELCQALTPRHVRELRPRLLRRSEGSTPEVNETGSGDG